MGAWPSFSEVSVASKLLGITLKRDAKRDEQVLALQERLREVEANFKALDSKMSVIADLPHGGAIG